MSEATLTSEEKRLLLAEILRQKTIQDETLWPLSRGQEALWFINQLAPESAAYNLMYAWRVKSELQIAALHRASQALVARHPMLRTVYAMSDGRPGQRILKQQNVTFEVTDASRWSDERLRAAVAEAAHRTFDLRQDCLLRVNLYTRAAEDHVLLLTVHHIASDFR